MNDHTSSSLNKSYYVFLAKIERYYIYQINLNARNCYLIVSCYREKLIFVIPLYSQFKIKIPGTIHYKVNPIGSKYSISLIKPVFSSSWNRTRQMKIILNQLVIKNTRYDTYLLCLYYYSYTNILSSLLYFVFFYSKSDKSVS